MSNFRFGADDYKLNYYPPEASDGIGGVDWDKVEFVEIEFDVYVKEHTCKIFRVSNTRDIRECSACGKHIYLDNAYNRSHLNYCPNCGAKVVGE